MTLLVLKPMTELNRRTLVKYLVISGALPSTFRSAPAEPGKPPQAPPKFDFDDVVRRARDLATADFDTASPALPEALNKLDFDAWRDIRFRPDRAFLAANGSRFRLQLFHLGHLYRRPVTINTLRDGIPTPIPYAANLFDYGRTKIDKPLPVNLGFAGFRLHYPLNSPKVFDEVIAFLGASYFRFLGRDQRYGMSARALAVGAGTPAEEFPFFREFWIETPEPNPDQATIYALLDSPSATGAYRFELYPGIDAAIEISAALFPRKPNVKFGLAPLTAMFFIGEDDHRFNDDFRPELHDADGLLIHSGTGEWIWRPLRNPTKLEVSDFLDRDLRGFGLLQRDRDFDHYQDLDLAYEMRPSYFVEPRESWGAGRVELVELPTEHETNDNIVASFVPKDAPEPGKAFQLCLPPRRQSQFDRALAKWADAEHLSDDGRRARLSRTAGAWFAPVHYRFRRRRPRLLRRRSAIGRGRSVHEPGQNRSLLHRSERPYQRVSRGHRRAARSRPIGGFARLPADRHAGAHRDLDLSVARRISAFKTAARPSVL